MAGEPIKVTIPFYPLLQRILCVLKFPPPVFQFLDESRNNVYLSVRAETEHVSYVYLGGNAERVSDSCEKASHEAVKDLMKKFKVTVEDITSARKAMMKTCAGLYDLKRRELERAEKGLPPGCLGEDSDTESNETETVCVDYMSVLRSIFMKASIKCTPIETVETRDGVYVSWLTLTPSVKVPQIECLFSDESVDLVAAKENLAKKVILYLAPIYNLEIVDANYDVSETKYNEVLCALSRESYLTVKERVLGVKEAVEPSVLLVEQDCITPKAVAYRTSSINCPPLPPKKKFTMNDYMKPISTGKIYKRRTKFYKVPAELETVIKRAKTVVED